MKKEKNKINDNENIENYRKREILRWVIMTMSVLTIVLAILSLTIKLGFGYALVSYLITHVLISMRNKLEIKESDLVKSKKEEKKKEKSQKKANKVTKKSKKTIK